MKDDLLKILEETNQNRIDVKAALKQVIDLLIHSGINCCKKCKNPIAIGHRFCNGECRQSYYNYLGNKSESK